MALVHINDMITDLHHAVHIVGVDHGGDLVLVCDLIDKFIDQA
jgi:hypothetical protein